MGGRHVHDGDICPSCSVRATIEKFFIDQGRTFGVEAFVNGAVGAAAHIAAAHVLPGHEAEERRVLQDQIGELFDTYLKICTERDAALAVKQ